MREPFKVGVVGVSLAALFGVLGRMGVSVALDNPPPPATPFMAVTAASTPAARDLGPPSREARSNVLAETSVAAFGPPPSTVEFGRRSAATFGEPSTPFAETREDWSGEPVLLTRDQLEAKGKKERRARLAGLAAEVATLASDAELDRLIGELETTVAEKRAEAELRQARAALERVVAAFPQTVAANAARDMLRHDEPSTKVVPVEAPR